MSDLILIVEDERDLVGTLEYNLQKEGYDTRAVYNGRDALRIMEDDTGEPSPDLVLLDLMLPDISGTEVCRRIRDRDETTDIPVVMLTARGASGPAARPLRGDPPEHDRGGHRPGFEPGDHAGQRHGQRVVRPPFRAGRTPARGRHSGPRPPGVARRRRRHLRGVG